MFNINQYLEEIACPSCKSSDFNILRKANYQGIKDLEGLLRIYKSSADELMLDQLVCCTSCNLTYLNPRIKSEIILQSYTDNTDEKHASQDAMRYKTFKRSLKKILAKIDNPETKNKKFLDIGSAEPISKNFLFFVSGLSILARIFFRLLLKVLYRIASCEACFSSVLSVYDCKIISDLILGLRYVKLQDVQQTSWSNISSSADDL